MGTHESFLQEMEVHPARFDTRFLRSQAEVDHHDPSIAEDHVRSRQVAVDDSRPVQATHNPADFHCGFQRGGATILQDALHGWALDELRSEEHTSELQSQSNL